MMFLLLEDKLAMEKFENPSGRCLGCQYVVGGDVGGWFGLVVAVVMNCICILLMLMRQKTQRQQF